MVTVADYITDVLIKFGVTDTFGVPGGVILKLLYAMEKKAPKLTPHLNYNEQMAGFSACGYAQARRRLGVAYATMGPGITNMLTCMAEAYQESLSVLFITAHGNRHKTGRRFDENQELDLVNSVSSFTKFAANVETVEDVVESLNTACSVAVKGRRGPVFLDFHYALFDQDIEKAIEGIERYNYDAEEEKSFQLIKEIEGAMLKAKRPVFLIGDGLRQASDISDAVCKLESFGIPIISSRAAQDIAASSELYFGYIGSHGTRYGNFILSKADLIIAIGNRLAFPMKSESFAPIVNNALIIRLDIDNEELERKFPNEINFNVNLCDFFETLQRNNPKAERKKEWVRICNVLKRELENCDISEPVSKLIGFLEKQKSEAVYVCDIGNNEFWFARAYEKVKPKGQILYSKAFGTLGASIGRAIGAYYATRKKVICIIGDQGFQYNLQELQYIAYWKLPIQVVLLNNAASGMIADHEKKLFGDNLIHVTKGTGYGTPDFKRIVEAYNILFTSDVTDDKLELPSVIEIAFDEAIELTPNLPKGSVCQNMFPPIRQELYDTLEQM